MLIGPVMCQISPRIQLCSCNCQLS